MKTINELFVPYVLAVKLSNKGFKEPVLANYVVDTTNKEGVHSLVLSGVYRKNGNRRLGLVSAPLYQEVVEFFINKGITIRASEFPVYNGKFGYICGWGSLSGWSVDFDGNSRQDAWNKAIEQALTLIK